MSRFEVTDKGTLIIELPLGKLHIDSWGTDNAPRLFTYGISDPDWYRKLAQAALLAAHYWDTHRPPEGNKA